MELNTNINNINNINDINNINNINNINIDIQPLRILTILQENLLQLLTQKS